MSRWAIHKSNKINKQIQSSSRCQMEIVFVKAWKCSVLDDSSQWSGSFWDLKPKRETFLLLNLKFFFSRMGVGKVVSKKRKETGEERIFSSSFESVTKHMCTKSMHFTRIHSNLGWIKCRWTDIAATCPLAKKGDDPKLPTKQRLDSFLIFCFI